MELITLPNAARLLGLSDSSVRKYVQRGLLPAQQMGLRKRGIKPEDLEAFRTSLQQGTLNIEIAAPKKAKRK